MRVLLDHHNPVTRRERFAQSLQKIPSNIGSFKLSKISNTDKNTGQVNAGKGSSEDDNILWRRYIFVGPSVIRCLKALIETCDGVWDDESDEFTIELDLVRRHGTLAQVFLLLLRADQVVHSCRID